MRSKSDDGDNSLWQVIVRHLAPPALTHNDSGKNSFKPALSTKLATGFCFHRLS